jgi:hypothetical protein
MRIRGASTSWNGRGDNWLVLLMFFLGVSSGEWLDNLLLEVMKSPLRYAPL